MKILVTTGLGLGVHAFGNMGDVAQLQTGIARLGKLWPTATIAVLTELPEDLRRFCPAATPLPAVGCTLWIGEELLLGRSARFVPARAIRNAIRLKKAAALRSPAILKWCLTTCLRLKNQQAEIDAVSSFSETIATADLVVATGSGGFFDGSRAWNMATLDVIEAAIHRNIPVAMFGQHFGPLTDADVLSRARRILPAVNLVTLRNPGARTLLGALRVPAHCIQVTGDEAIEVAYEARPGAAGTHLGVSFRLGGSAATDESDIARLRPVLQRCARTYEASLIPVPISLDSYTHDDLSIRQLLQGFDDQSDGGAHLKSPLDVITQVGRCRVLVTSAYHAAVFALAQGIPVVALARSPYFIEKFYGLEKQFGSGCQTHLLTEPDLPQKLGAAIDAAWQSAGSMRVLLQEAALRQIESSWNAYHQVRDFVETFRRTCRRSRAAGPGSAPQGASSEGS